MCLWLDHYPHQHGGCGPMGTTWLGGIATFTTARDRCTETVYCSSTIIIGCITWCFNLRTMLSSDLCFHWDVVFPCLHDVSFTHSLL